MAERLRSAVRDRRRPLVAALLGLALLPGVASATTTTTGASPTKAPSAANAALSTTTNVAPADPAITTTSAAVTSTATATATTTATVTTTATTTAATQTKTATRSGAAAKNARARIGHKAPPTLSGWLSAGPTFPSRAIVVRHSASRPVAAGALTVTENGVVVHPTSVTPLSDPGPDDLGILFAVGNSPSMRSGLPAVFSALAALTSQRSPDEQLSLTTFDSRPTTALAFTANADRIETTLADTPLSAAGADLSAATHAAVTQIASARLAMGVLVVISDGVDLSADQASAAAATAAHVPVITVGLRDAAATSESLAVLRRWAPGPYVTVTAATLSAVVDRSLAEITGRDEVVRYHSTAIGGAHVAVDASVPGARGGVLAEYVAPTPHRTVKRVTKRPVRHRHRAAVVHRASNTSILAPSPAFAVGTSAAATSRSGFWSTGPAVLVISLIAALLLGAGIAFALRRPSQRAVRMRVGRYLPVEADAGDGAAVGEARRPLAVITNGAWWGGFLEAVEISRSTRSAGYLMKRAAIIAVIVAILIVAVTHKVIYGFVPLLGFPFVERWWVLRVAEKQRTKFADTLPSYMQDMASAIRVGRSFVSAMAIVADGAEEPTRSELERAVTDEALGRPLEASLTAVGQRMHSSDVDQLALIAELNRRSGSNVAEALDRVSEGARDRADLRREIRALTAQAKMSSSVLTGLPIVLCLGLSLIAPKYAHPLFHTGYGIAALIVAAVFIFTGWKVMQKISRVGV